MTLEQWKRSFKKANQRVDKTFANYAAFLETHFYYDDCAKKYFTLGNGTCLQMNWFAGRKSGWAIMCWATECGGVYRQTSAGYFKLVSYRTVKRMEEAIERAIDKRENLLGAIERAQTSGLQYDAYKDDSVWTHEAQSSIL